MEHVSNDEPVTALLRAAGRDERRAATELLPLVYAELRKLARARMAHVRPGETLQATALVHEAYVRLVGQDDPGWQGRGHFFFAAARAMHDILVEHARRKARLKRGGGRRRVDPANLALALDAPAEDILALDEALRRLERSHSRRYRVVMLRFFAGLTHQQTAEALGVTLRTVERDWRWARVRLYEDLACGNGGNEDWDKA